MPHTNRKKKQVGLGGTTVKSTKPAYIKRQQVEDEDGWTHIVDAKRTPRKIEAEDFAAKRFWDGDAVSGSAAVINMTFDEIHVEHQRAKQKWLASKACADLKDLLAPFKDIASVEGIVCFGLGTLQDWRLQARRTSHIQLAALRTIADALGLSKAECYAQEPRATALDNEFLKSQGLQTLEDPEAFGKIDTKSLVFAVHCYPQLYRAILNQPHPVILIANDLSAYTEDIR